MKASYLLFCSLLTFAISAVAQNLIKNPGFENYYTYVDSNKNLVYHPEYWYYNSKDSNHPIYFSTARYLNKSLNWNFHPDSLLIKQGHKGDYISIVILPNIQKAYTAFTEPLTKGVQYHLSLDIRAFELSNCLSDLLVGFKDCLTCTTDSCLYQLKLVIPDSLCNDSLFHYWLRLSTDFISRGNEKVLVISAGSSNDYSKMVNANLNKFLIRRFDFPFKLKYYVDNVCLTPYSSRHETSFGDKIDSLSIGESIVLQNIYFDFNKYILLNESFPLLDNLAEYLDKNPKVSILISGHTDNIGSDEYNKELSSKRAKSVADYLVHKGIDMSRLQSTGFGSKIPIALNETEEGRHRNRRIEMKIVFK